MKKSLALIGIKWKAYQDFIERLANHCQLILVSEINDVEFDETIYDVPSGAITVQSCAKEGCWEADLIFLMNDAIEDLNLLSVIKDVSTQKVVVGFSETFEGFSMSRGLSALTQRLPHSKVLWGYVDEVERKVFLSGRDREAWQFIEKLVTAIGYGLSSVENSRPIDY